MTIDWTKVHENQHLYIVLVDDNFHFQDESEQYAIIGFATAAAALEKCHQIVETSLMEAYKPGQSVEQIMEHYLLGGEDPWIRSPSGQPGIHFSAGEYAKARALAFVKRDAGTLSTNK